MTPDDLASQVQEVGWAVLPPENTLLDWVNAVRPTALATLEAPEHQHWWRSGGTWFVGVNVLDNDASGAVEGGPGLQGAMVNAVTEAVGPVAWDRAQVSVCLPGFPKQADESDAAFAFRLNRDGAHLDGLLPSGPERRRHMQEFHRFILGVPLTKANHAASPLVLWEGSHRPIGEMLRAELIKLPTDQWPGIDLTDVYANVRRMVFETCPRRTVHVAPGGCYLLHRHLLHGVQPWGDKGQSEPPGRAIAYFRPEAADRGQWLADTPLV